MARHKQHRRDWGGSVTCRPLVIMNKDDKQTAFISAVNADVSVDEAATDRESTED